MIFHNIFEQFLAEAPVGVMFRALMQHALDPNELDRLFERNAQKQYHRELLFSTVVDLLAQVVCRSQPSLHAAYQAPQALDTSLAAVYQKLQGIEPVVCHALVSQTAARLGALTSAPEMQLPQPIAGYHAKILDGNHLAGTEHRLQPTRTSHAAPLPGVILVLLDMATALITDVIADTDAYTSEHTLAASILERVQRDDLWIADRGLCSMRLFLGIAERDACFVVRQHASNQRWEEAGAWSEAVAVESGTVREQPVRVFEVDEPHRILALRRIAVQLTTPTRNGESEVFLLTNLPAESAAAGLVAQTYRRRWTVETAFQGLTQALRCEVKTLAYRGAALLGFCLACVAWNILAVIRGALRAEHGTTPVEQRVSNYHLVGEVASTRQGMMIALPPETWAIFEGLSTTVMVEFLRQAACQVRLRKYPRAHHGAKKPRPQRTGKFNDHVSTKRLLDEVRQQKTSP